MIPVDKEHKMTKEFVGLIDPNNAYSFVAGNVKAFYKISKKITDKAVIRRMGEQVGVIFTQAQIDEIFEIQTGE